MVPPTVIPHTPANDRQKAKNAKACAFRVTGRGARTGTVYEGSVSQKFQINRSVGLTVADGINHSSSNANERWNTYAVGEYAVFPDGGQSASTGSEYHPAEICLDSILPGLGDADAGDN